MIYALVGMPVQDSASSHGYTSFKSIDEPKLGLWRTLATRAKGILDEDGLAHKFEDLRKERPRSDATASSKDQVGEAQSASECLDMLTVTSELVAHGIPDSLSSVTSKVAFRSTSIPIFFFSVISGS
jgi:hypothetical protein